MNKEQAERMAYLSLKKKLTVPEKSELAHLKRVQEKYGKYVPVKAKK